MSEHEELLAENKRNDAIIADLQARESALLGVLRDLEMQVRDRGMEPILSDTAVTAAALDRAHSVTAGRERAQARDGGPFRALFSLSMKGLRLAVVVTVIGVAVVAVAKAAEQGLDKVDRADCVDHKRDSGEALEK